MRIIIVGAGLIGTNLAQALTDEGHEIYLIESREEVARKANEKLDAKIVVGNGADPETLRRTDPSASDLVIAVTTSDETNLVVCSLAASFGARRCIARVRNTSLSRVVRESGYEYFHVDEIINPEQVAAQAIVKAIEAPGAREVADFASGKIMLRAVEVPETSPLCGLRVEELNTEDFPWPFLIIAIIRDGNVLIPKGTTLIFPKDRIYALLPAASLGEFLSFVNPQIRKPRKIVVYGATDIGQHVAATLAPKIPEIILVEENPDSAHEAAGLLASTRVINGSACDLDILRECGVEATDVFIAVTNNDHSNLVSAVLAKRMGAKSTVISTRQPDYITIVDALGIDFIINPRYLAADQILRLVRGKGISAVMKLVDCGTEVLEFVPEEGAPVTVGPIKEIPFPKNSLVGAVCTESDVILAKGDTRIVPGSRVIVFCHGNEVKKLQSLFTRKKH